MELLLPSESYLMIILKSWSLLHDIEILMTMSEQCRPCEILATTTIIESFLIHTNVHILTINNVRSKKLISPCNTLFQYMCPLLCWWDHAVRFCNLENGSCIKEGSSNFEFWKDAKGLNLINTAIKIFGFVTEEDQRPQHNGLGCNATLLITINFP